MRSSIFFILASAVFALPEKVDDHKDYKVDHKDDEHKDWKMDHKDQKDDDHKEWKEETYEPKDKYDDYKVLNHLESYDPYGKGFPLYCPKPSLAPIPGKKCPILGQQVCLGSGAFITCSSGNVWSVVQKCGTGTVCTSYPGNNCYVLCTQATIPKPPVHTPTCPKPSGIPVPGASCTTLGQQVCLGTGSFITCASGNKWSVKQNCGTGTKCQGYPGNDCYVLCGY